MVAATSRERLVSAARACLLRHGHAACSVKVIAREAGVNHGLVHHYFGSKEALWAEVVQAEAKQVRESLQSHEGDFMDGFYGPQMLRHPDRMRLAVELLGLAKSNPSVAGALREHFRLNREAMRQRLGVDREALATLVFAALFGLVIQGGVDPDLPVQEAAQELLRIIGAKGPSAPGTPPQGESLPPDGRGR